MTELQKLILLFEQLKREQQAAFAKHDDVSKMSQDEIKGVAERNDQMKNLSEQIKTLTELEEMRKGAQPAPTFHNSETRENKTETLARDRNVEIARVKTLPRVGPVKHFKGNDAELKAFQFGMWLLGSVLDGKVNARLSEKAKTYCKEWGIEVKAQSEGVNTAGGYLVPTEFGNDIIDLREEYGVFRANTKVVPMARDTQTWPRRVSGLTVYYPGEGVAITESQKAWDMITLTARKYACLALYSSELNEDAIISIGDDLASEIAYAFALAEDTNGFNGDGTSTYAGTVGVRQRLLDVFTVSGGTGLIVGSGNAYSELVLTDFEAVLGALPIYARRAAKWYCSSTFFHTVMHKLQLAAGGVTSMEIANGGQYRFLGLPVVESQVLPSTAANSQIPCFLGDLMLASKLGDRREMTLTYSTDYKFAEDQLAIKGTQRIDINVHDVGATGTAGPIVGLIMASS